MHYHPVFWRLVAIAAMCVGLGVISNGVLWPVVAGYLLFCLNSNSYSKLSPVIPLRMVMSYWISAIIATLTRYGVVLVVIVMAYLWLTGSPELISGWSYIPAVSGLVGTIIYHTQ